VSASSFGEVLWNPDSAELGARNAILSQSWPKSTPPFAGALSIKHMLSGTAVWTSGRRRFRVFGAAFLVLNHGTEYALERRVDGPTESFCPFFARGFVESAARAVRVTDDELLEDPSGDSGAEFEAREQIYASHSSVVSLLRALAGEIRTGAASGLRVEEAFVELAGALVRAQDGVAAEIARIPAAREATRRELHARLQRGRERMHDGFAERLGLAEIARAAAVAPHHFHRAFRAAYGVTPHRYLTRLRLERAARALEASDAPVTEICAAVGFESLASFGALFRRELGRSPLAHRRAAQLRKIRSAAALGSR
jgi:AraC-like DNA-binding protein